MRAGSAYWFLAVMCGALIGCSDSGEALTVKMSLSAYNLKLGVGDTAWVHVGGSESYVVSSNDEAVATVEREGRHAIVTGMGEGEAEVRFASAYKELKCYVTVEYGIPEPEDKALADDTMRAGSLRYGEPGVMVIENGESEVSFIEIDTYERLTVGLKDGMIVRVARNGVEQTMENSSIRQETASRTWHYVELSDGTAMWVVLQK